MNLDQIKQFASTKYFWYGIAAGFGLSILARNKWLILAGAAGAYYYYTKQQNIQTVSPVPVGGKLTGQVKATLHGGRPGEEVLGYGKRTWAEISLPSGQRDWIEVRVS